MTKVEKNRVIRSDIINLENKITWISPKIPLGTKMAHYKTHFLLWEKPLIAAASQLLEQNRHSQAMRRLLDNNKENGCKE